MKDTSERWLELADAQAIGETLTAEELAFLRAHADDPELADEQALYADIARLGDDAPADLDDRRRAEDTLARFRAGQRTATTARTRAFAIIGVLAAAALAVWFALPRGWLRPDSTLAARVSEGSLVLAGDELASGAELPGGQWLRAEAPACIQTDDGRACFDGGTEVRIVEGTLELRAGSVRVDEGSIPVLRAGERDELDAGESWSVASEPPATVVVAERAVPRVDEPSRAPSTPSTIAPPEEAVAPTPIVSIRPKPQARPSKPLASASEMLAEARKLANAKALSDAVAAYDALRRAYPDSADARAANVSIGELQLRRGRAREALKAFERYLKAGGALAEEARWGRVRALDRLGKTSARDRAIDQLLAAHPQSIYAGEAKTMRAR